MVSEQVELNGLGETFALQSFWMGCTCRWASEHRFDQTDHAVAELCLDLTTGRDTWQSDTREEVAHMEVGEDYVQACWVGVGGGGSEQTGVDH